MLLASAGIAAPPAAHILCADQAPCPIVKADHAIVYRRDDQFAAWPHTMGFWNFGNGRLLQNIMAMPTDYASADAISHDRIGKGSKYVALRSSDFGRTWNGAHPDIDMFARIAKGTAAARHVGDLGPLDTRDPRLLIANSGPGFGSPDGRTQVRISRDGGDTWTPPIDVPLDGLNAISGMNSTLIRPDGTALIWLMEVSKDGWNRHPVVFALPPGGQDFHFLSFITPKTDPYGAADGDWRSTYRFGGHRWFYPRGYLMPGGRILCVLRCQRDPRGVMWTEVHASDDGARTWRFLSRVNDFGAPGSLVRMRDGRLVMVYGYRLAPYGIRAKVSADEGRTWGRELIVRDDGGSWDLGYPNAWETDDGRVGTVYYFNTANDRIQANGGVRHIARSIFSID